MFVIVRVAMSTFRPSHYRIPLPDWQYREIRFRSHKILQFAVRHSNKAAVGIARKSKQILHVYPINTIAVYEILAFNRNITRVHREALLQERKQKRSRSFRLGCWYQQVNKLGNKGINHTVKQVQQATKPPCCCPKRSLK